MNTQWLKAFSQDLLFSTTFCRHASGRCFYPRDEVDGKIPFEAPVSIPLRSYRCERRHYRYCRRNGSLWQLVCFSRAFGSRNPQLRCIANLSREISQQMPTFLAESDVSRLWLIVVPASESRRPVQE
jgi:hypothetical protein